VLPSDVANELIAVGVIALLVLIMRWVFAPSRRDRAGPPIDATDAAELGLLTVVATVSREEATTRRAQLSRRGLRSSISRRQDGRVDLLVFQGDADAAREILRL
jgi:hypothetical protein